MSLVHIQIRAASHPLTRPYVLSFGTVRAFETFYVIAEDSRGIGVGEITPLPGYSAETPESVRTSLLMLCNAVAQGNSLGTSLAEISAQAPMVVSGVNCALDTLSLGSDTVFEARPPAPIPCVGLCGGTGPETASAAAETLLENGYTILKVKIGGAPISADIARCLTILETVGDRGLIRIDANQGLTPNAFEKFLSALPSRGVELVEQPFAPSDDHRMADYVHDSPVPLMLDESIWTANDILRAADLGVRLVKLKLCKHPGLAATRTLIEQAQALGLDIVFGNGVQGPVGNRAELFLYSQAKMTRAIEANGFAKMVDAGLETGLTLDRGCLQVDCPTPAHQWAKSGKTLAEFDAVC